MKKIGSFLIGLATIILISCSGSDAYRGSWKAIDAEGDSLILNFDANSFILTDTNGNNSVSYEYTQNAVKIENSAKTYGIRLNNGGEFSIFFPAASNATAGYIYDIEGTLLYIISRTHYPSADHLN